MKLANYLRNHRAMHRRIGRPTAVIIGACLTIIAGLVMSTSTYASPQSSADRDSTADAANLASWQQRLDRVDRAALDTIIGFAAADTDEEGLTWTGPSLPGGATSLADLRGKVIVLQSWSCGSTAGRSALTRAEQMLRKVSSDDCILIGVHTPEDVEKLETFLSRKPAEVPVIIDRTGTWCDAMGIYRTPVNIVIDRQGAVRFAGLRARSVSDAVEYLLAESFKEDVEPKERPKQVAATPVDFPKPMGAVSNAKDLRGQPSPPFHVDQWITRQPDITGRVVVIDFFATWCPPCRAAIPHLNELQAAFSGDVAVIGISDEHLLDFNNGCKKHGISERNVSYALAIDPKKSMAQVVRVTAIPHIMVVSSDGIVRYQGSPSNLTRDLLGQIVAANASLTDAQEIGRWARATPR
ncbi:MAG: redoxin domain-containing protein [Phycisphaerales bacterium]|nr:redoxin domain-containing protein [Phycisphaerales bacterium]